MYLKDNSNCFYSTELRVYNNVIIMSNNKIMIIIVNRRFGMWEWRVVESLGAIPK